MSWWTGAALGFDTETDGPVPTEARIIESGLVLVTPGNAPNVMQVLIQPERDIPEEAIKIHGITTERAQEEGALREVGITQIAVTIAELASPSVPLVGHNASYDLTLLDREMRRIGLGHISTDRETGLCVINVGPATIGEPFPVIDTYVLDKAVDRYRKGKRQLSFAAEHYGVPMTEGAAHGAVADVFASLRIAWRISKVAAMAQDYLTTNQVAAKPLVLQWHPFMKIYGGRRDPLDIVRAFAETDGMAAVELHAAQRRWAVEQAEGLRDYFVKKGDTEAAESVDGRWPVRPLAAIEDVDTTLI